MVNMEFDIECPESTWLELTLKHKSNSQTGLVI